MAAILTFNNELPQGSPASVVMCNLVLRKLDRTIQSLCERHDFSYTRYIDDITISGDEHLRNYQDKFNNFILDFGYLISENKLTTRSGCQIVTGLVVNQGLRPTNEFLDSLSATLKACIDGYLPEICTTEDLSPQQLLASLRGQIAHVRQFTPIRAKQFDNLLDRIKYSVLPELLDRSTPDANT
jgi:hypothetical protein